MVSMAVFSMPVSAMLISLTAKILTGFSVDPNVKIVAASRVSRKWDGSRGLVFRDLRVKIFHHRDTESTEVFRVRL